MQASCKSSTSSLHSQNAVLYGFGVAINAAVYIVRKMLDPTVPGFLVGFGSLSALALIVLQSVLGIIITYVYRCALRIARFGPD